MSAALANLNWLDTEFGMSQTTADRFVQVAKQFGGKLPMVGNYNSHCGDNPAKMIPQDSIARVIEQQHRWGWRHQIPAAPWAGYRMGRIQRFWGFFALEFSRGRGATEIPKSMWGFRTAWGSRAQNFSPARGLISAFDFKEIK